MEILATHTHTCTHFFMSVQQSLIHPKAFVDCNNIPPISVLKHTVLEVFLSFWQHFPRASPSSRLPWMGSGLGGLSSCFLGLLSCHPGNHLCLPPFQGPVPQSPRLPSIGLLPCFSAAQRWPGPWSSLQSVKKMKK